MVGHLLAAPESEFQEDVPQTTVYCWIHRLKDMEQLQSMTARLEAITAGTAA